MMAVHRDISFKADGETLQGTLISPPSGRHELCLLSLHGAGNAIRERVFYLANALVTNGVATFAFDFSGHGDRTGHLHESTLARRISQASSALLVAELDAPLILMGSSMGGFIAASLAITVNAAGLILLCPALYDDAALKAPFDCRFSELIRVKDSYERSTLPDRLRNYTGHVLSLIGSEDCVIPARISEIYQSSFESARSTEFIRINGAPHRLHAWASQSSSAAATILNPIRGLISKVRESSGHYPGEATSGECEV
jgi:pimeloyl-ACP methyl ester carboxylesterase